MFFFSITNLFSLGTIYFYRSLACEQALQGALWRRGGKRKESLQLRLWNLGICIEKVEAKC